MPTLARTPPGFDLLSLVVGWLDHFLYFVTGDHWTSVLTDSGGASVSDAANGILTITASDGSVVDNDQSYVKATTETLLFAANRSINFAALCQYAEANTDDANIFIGFCNAVAAELLIDDGGGVKSSFSGAAFYKVDGGTVWHVISSVGTTRTDTTTDITAGGSAYHLFEIEFRAIDSTTGEISFLYDGAVVTDSNGRPVKHQITYTGATEMQAGFGVKNGDSNLETLKVDAAAYWQNK